MVHGKAATHQSPLVMLSSPLAARFAALILRSRLLQEYHLSGGRWSLEAAFSLSVSLPKSPYNLWPDTVMAAFYGGENPGT